MHFSLLPFLHGFGVSAGLIIAIGAQNAFVLRQGLKRERLFIIAFTSSISDLFLITLGIGGFGSYIAGSEILTQAASWGGAIFLFFYGWRSFQSASVPQRIVVDSDSTETRSVSTTILAALAFSFLNPHVYLDTVVLIGGIGAQYPPDGRIQFGMGAAIVSFIWFFGLAYGAARFAPIFANPTTWRWLDIGIGVLMWVLGVVLIV